MRQDDLARIDMMVQNGRQIVSAFCFQIPTTVCQEDVRDAKLVGFFHCRNTRQQGTTVSSVQDPIDSKGNPKGGKTADGWSETTDDGPFRQ